MPRMLVHASSQTWPGIWLMAVGGNVVWLPRSLLKRKQRPFSSVQWLRLHLLMMGCGFNPWSGSWDPTCLIAKKLHPKTETICNKFSKDLKKKKNPYKKTFKKMKQRSPSYFPLSCCLEHQYNNCGFWKHLGLWGGSDDGKKGREEPGKRMILWDGCRVGSPSL